MYAIGFDIGGTKCAVSLGEIENGSIQVLHRFEIPTTTPHQTLDALLPHAIEWKNTYGAKTAGVSCGGPLNSTTGVIVSPPNLPLWHGFAITDYIREKSGLVAALENDANACAVAEWKFGAGQGTKNMVFLTFGTGLGAGLILDGRLYDGTNGNAGECGHIRLAPRGPVGYHKKGSFEGFCSGGGIAQLGRAYAEKNLPLPWCQSVGDLEKITAKSIALAAASGDPAAKEIMAESGRRLGQALAVMIDLLNPERIIIGSIFQRSEELLRTEMEKVIEQETLEQNRAACQILPAELGDTIGDIAALSVALY